MCVHLGGECDIRGRPGHVGGWPMEQGNRGSKRARVCLSQGINVRMITTETAEALALIPSGNVFLPTEI
jgi:hypothetical protein